MPGVSSRSSLVPTSTSELTVGAVSESEHRPPASSSSKRRESVA